MSRIIVTDRFLRLKGDLPTARLPASRPERLIIEPRASSHVRNSNSSAVLPKYLEEKSQNSKRITVNLGTKKLEFASLREAELWQVKKRHEILSPRALLQSDRNVESSINGIRLLDGEISKKYNRMLYDETRIERLNALHNSISSRQNQLQESVEKRLAERHRAEIKELEEQQKAYTLERSKELEAILDRRTRVNFRRAKRVREQHAKVYGPFWSKQSDFEI